MVITQFDLESIERLGLVKIDLLGIRGLTVLGDVVEIIAKEQTTHTTCIQRTSMLHRNPGDHPREDPAVSQMVSQGRTIGCFQIESPGMRATLKEVKASSVDDLMVALSLYRPGPLTGGLKDAFVRRHLGKEATEHLHPALSSLLEDTYGVILYQEQVLRIAHELAGFQPGRCRPAAQGDVSLRPGQADADTAGEIRGGSMGEGPGSRRDRQPHLGADGSLCGVRVSRKRTQLRMPR